MNRSLLPSLKAGLSRLHPGNRAARAGQQGALTERRVTERRYQFADFRHRDFRLRATAQVAGLGTYDLDYSTGHNYWSPELKAIAGLPADMDEVPLERVRMLVHPEDRERVFGKMEASLDPAGDGQFDDEHRLVRPDGTIRWVKVRGQTFFDGQGRRVLGASGIVIDITERRQAEILLKEQSEELRLALRVGNSGTFRWDTRTHVHRWCDEMLALYGLRREEFRGRDEDWLDCLLPEDRASTWAVIERSIETGSYTADFRIRRRDDGEIRWISGRGQVYYGIDGAPEFMLGINVDITDQKHAEERLQESETRFRLMADAAPAMIWLAGTDRGCTWFNRPWLAFTGRRLEEELGYGWATAIHPEDRERCLRLYEAAFDRCESFAAEYRIRRHDGEYRWLLDQGVPRYEGEVFAGYIGSAIDITLPKQAQLDLEESRARLEAILDSLSEGVVVFDLEGQVRSTNPAARHIMGYSTAEAANRRLPEFSDTFEVLAMDGRPLPLHEWPIGRVMGGESFTDFDIDLRRKDDGSSRIISHNGRPVRKDGEVILGVLTLRDVTERHQAAKALEESERRLAVALEASGSAVWEMDVADQIVHGEPLLFTMLGYAPGELKTLADWHGLVHEADRKGLSEKVGRVIQGELASCRVELRVRAKDGTWHWVLSQAAAAERDAEGRALRLVGTHTNIDERKGMEEALRLQSSRLQGILDHAPLLVWIRDLQGRTVLANRAFFETVDVPPPGEFIGRSIFEVFPRKVAKRLWANDQWTLENEAPIHKEDTVRHRDGSSHTYLSITFPVRDIQTGDPRSVCSICIDITERNAAEARIRSLNVELEARIQERTAELQQANAALLQTNAELKHFAHATAHDLQTPLRSIAGFTQLLQREVQGQGDDRLNDWSSLVVDNTKRLQTLIQELLSYTRLENHGLPFQETDLRTLVDEVLDSLDNLVAATGAEVTCGDLPTLPVDRTQMALVLQNLVENGIKYNQSRPPKVAIACELHEDEWVFSVSDNGMGIDPRHHERIFEIFRRLHAYHQVPGTGIGLALCRRIVERHGGHIWMISEPGKGSTFYFSLPAHRDEGR